MIVNNLPNVLKKKGIENPNQLRVATGLGRGTVIKAMNDPRWCPSPAVMTAICRTFNLQPGEFLEVSKN